jgi:hypothetical protein
MVLEPAVDMIQQMSLPFGILMGVLWFETTVVFAAVKDCQKTTVPVPQVEPVPYFNVGNESAAVPARCRRAKGRYR